MKSLLLKKQMQTIAVTHSVVTWTLVRTDLCQSVILCCRPYSVLAIDSRSIFIGVDVSFPYAKNVYGLPEHTVSLSLPNTRVGSGSQPGSR
jgi:hypothetical protein